MADLTIKEVCKELKISRQTFYTLDKEGSFPNAYKLNGRIRRIPLSDIEALKQSHKKEAS